MDKVAEGGEVSMLEGVHKTEDREVILVWINDELVFTLLDVLNVLNNEL